MTKDTAMHSEFAGLNRLQLQALCVKAGLSTTGENEELKKILEEHRTQHGHTDLEDAVAAAGAATAVAEAQQTQQEQSVAEAAEIMKASVSEETRVTVDVAMGQTEHHKTTTTTTTLTETTQVKLEVKTEDAELDASDALNTDALMESVAAENTSVKHEAPEQSPFVVNAVEQQEEVTVKQEDSNAGDNSETHSHTTEETVTATAAIKEEINEAEMPLADVKVEETSVPIAQRKQFWEARTTTTSSTTTRSALPVSKARLAAKQQSTSATGSQRSASASRSASTTQKRSRPSEDVDGEHNVDGDVHIKDEQDTEDGINGSDSPGSSLPTPGTVRNLIGRFAGSTVISPPSTPTSAPFPSTIGSPANKKRKMDNAKSSPSSSTVTSPVVPRYKRVIKIPVAGTGTSKTYASRPGVATTTTRAAAALRRKALSEASTSPAPASTSASSTTGAGGVKKTTAVSAETINRLATPKKVASGHASLAGSGVAPVAAPSFGSVSHANATLNSTTTTTTPAPTRPRGPVLTTASRAAQRRNREGKK